MATQRDRATHKNSFDVVRLLAALAVLVSHFYGMSGRGDPLDGLWGTDEDLGGFAVLIFFGISGYLITESILNGATLKFYSASRLLRIYPALIVCLVVCIVAGVFLTSLTLDGYFSAQTAQFFFGNVFPFFWQEQRTLPGVFVPPWNAMNGPLWTIKYELACYAVTLNVFLFPQARRRFVFMALCALAVILWLAPVDAWQIPPASTLSSRVLRFEYFNMGFFRYYAAIFFLVAVARVVVANAPYRWFGIFLFMGVVLVLSTGTPLGSLAIYATIALGGVYVGCSPLLYFNGLYRRKLGDLSYSTYLYGWPISILYLMSLYPHIGFWPTVMAAAATTLCLAYVSWHLVERRALRWKRFVSADSPVVPARTVGGFANRAQPAPADLK
jgi:peptidoglycan/LPS O-acetylase OafA/YrhL